MLRTFVSSLLAISPVAIAAAAQPEVGPAPWAFDEITLKNGSKFQGLIQEEAPEGVRFVTVSRPPGRSTTWLTCVFPRREIASLKKLSDDERKLLKKRLDELASKGEGERQRMESLELVTFDWPGKPGGARRYESEHFVLESTGTEELTRRSAVRLEQLYVAFGCFLPPISHHPERTRIVMATDREEYRVLLGPLGERRLLNPAIYDPQSNRILCWSDLKHLGSELQTARLHHSQQLLALDQYEASLKKLYKEPKELERFTAPVHLERGRVFEAERENGKKFDQATKRLFATLYHEAFHAYIGNFIFPPLSAADVKAGKGTGELPRWLNEGMAQVFESAVVEAGELRADSPDRGRLMRVRDCLKGKGPERLVPLGELLVTGTDAFLAFHEKGASNRAYLTSWALAYYLTFEARVIGTPAFRQYLVAVNSGGDPRHAFSQLVGKDLETFEKSWHAYLLTLRGN